MTSGLPNDDEGRLVKLYEEGPATRRAPGLVRAAERARDAWEPEAGPFPGADLCHRVEIQVVVPGVEQGVPALSVAGGAEVVAAALRAYADKICPVRPPPAAHRPTRRTGV